MTIHGHAFDLPATIPAGRQWWWIENAGPPAHALTLVRLAAGKTLATVTGDGDYVPAGGMATLAPGAGGWIELDLAPGEYGVLCYVPAAGVDPTHWMGTRQAFTVVG